MYSNTIEVICDTCGYETGHTIIKSNSDLLVRCEICGTVHMVRKPEEAAKEKFVDIRAVISKNDTSFVRRIRIPDEILKVGMEFIAEEESTGEATPVAITSIELENKRTEAAKAGEIKTIWARAIDEVTVKISINLGMITEPAELKVPGDREFIVGSSEKIKGISCRIKKIAQRDGKMKNRPGISVPAKDVIRIFAEPETHYNPHNLKNKQPEKHFHKNIIQKGKSLWSMRSRGRA